MDRGEIERPRPVRRGQNRRVCLYLNSWTFGGVEEHVATLAGRLPDVGYDPLVVSAELDSLRPLYDRLTMAGVPLHCDRRPQGPFGPLRSVIELARLLRAERIDVLHVQLIFFDGGRIPLMAAKMARVPAVVTHHAAPREPAGGLARLKRDVVLRASRHFIAVSEANRADQVRYMGLPPGDVTTVPNGIVIRSEGDPPSAHHALTDELGLPVEAKLIAAVGRFVHQKAFHRLVDALSKVIIEVPEAHLVFVGDGPLWGDLEAQAAALGIRDAVHFLGFRTDAAHLLDGVDMVASSSDYEGMPLVLLEAFAAGRPVVAFAVDGIPEVIEDGVHGYLVEPGDVDGLAARICDVLSNADRAASMGRRARARVEEDFSADLMARRTAAVYDSVHRGTNRDGARAYDGAERIDSGPARVTPEVSLG